MVERAYVMPPRSYLGVADDTLRNQLIASSPLYSKYAEAVDRESAYEILSVKAQQDAEAAARAQEEAALQKELRSRSAASKKEPPTVAEKLISKTMTRMENKAVDTIVRGIFNQMKKIFLFFPASLFSLQHTTVHVPTNVKPFLILFFYAFLPCKTLRNLSGNIP